MKTFQINFPGIVMSAAGLPILNENALLAFSESNSRCLRDIAVMAEKLAADLEKIEPTYELAMAAGIEDCGYDTVRHGWVSKYRGEAIVTMADGRKWKAVGYGPTGGPDWIGKQGGITFSLLPR